mmetsp:Transcript_90989/g.143717  ORF Transcript_90989/g.143717 Transcript_90989/m.143717 type:complete len:659 (+) Transcript_90989:58-2034(+)
MFDAVSLKADVTSRPPRCRSAAALRPLGLKAPVAAPNLRTCTSSSSSTAPPIAARVDQTKPCTAWFFDDGDTPPSISGVASQRQLIGSDAVAVGTGLQAARSNQYRRRLAKVIHSDLVSDHHLLMQAVSHGALPELPPGFARSLSPPQRAPTAKISAVGQDSIERRAPHVSVAEGSSRLYSRGDNEGRAALGRSPDMVATDPYLRILPLSGWIQTSPLIQGISSEIATSSPISWNADDADDSNLQAAGVAGSETQQRPKHSFSWQELIDLAKHCRLPMPPEGGTPEDLQIWSLKLQERVGKRRLAAYRKRVSREEADYSWKPSRKSKTVKNEVLPKPQQSIPESPAVPSVANLDQTDLPIGLEPSPSIENLQQGWWPELSVENDQELVDDIDDEGDSRLDVPDPVLLPTRRKQPKAPDMDRPTTQPITASVDKKDSEQDESEVISDNELAGDYEGLFREKEKLPANAMNGALFPLQSAIDIKEGVKSPTSVSGKAVMSNTMAVADDSLAAMFRRSVAEAWEPSNIEAIIESERQIAANERRAQIMGESIASKKHKGHSLDISNKDVAEVFAAFGGAEDDMDASIDNLNDLVCQRRVMARRDGYRRRFHARASRSVPTSRKWSQRVNACRHSMRGLDSLSTFAEYNRQHLKALNTVAAA